jgi:hypothetical protein
VNKLLLVTTTFLMLAPAVFAQNHNHSDKKGPHGGPMQDVVGVEAELVLAERTITIHIFNEAGKPVSVAGYSGSALVGAGQARQVVQLTPGTDNVLSGAATGTISRGATVTLQIKGPDGKSGQAKF